MDSHDARDELIGRLQRRCRDYEERIIELQKQLELAVTHLN